MNTFEILHGATHSPQQAISVKQNTRQAALTIFCYSTSCEEQEGKSVSIKKVQTGENEGLL